MLGRVIGAFRGISITSPALGILKPVDETTERLP